MEYVRHEALLDKKGDDGATYRSHLEAKERKSPGSAVNSLLGPEAPEYLLYLLEWASALVGRSGATMAGIVPLG